MTPRGSLLRTIGWAAYLACSWTWCIGMFLPVLLLRDYGPWSFLAFAAPNIIGAAAVGWVLTAARAREVVAKHKVAIAVFTGVTIAFQMAFVALALNWFVFPEGTQTLLVKWPLAAIFVAMLFLAILSNKWPLLSVLSWASSVAVSLWLALNDNFHFPTDWAAPSSGILFMAPVCVFGFLLCPFMDRSLLFVRESIDDRDSRLIFTLGFGFFFAAMILMTLGYARLLSIDTAGRVVSGVSAASAVVVAIHILPQLMFTMVAHIRGWEPQRPEPRPGLRAFGLAGATVFLALLLLPLVVAIGADTFGVRLPLSRGEFTYRLYLSFYGLVFPAYAWLCMIPTADGHHGPSRRKLLVCAGAIGIASPMFYMGFMELKAVWLGPGLLVVLLSRLFIRPKSVVPVPTGT